MQRRAKTQVDLIRSQLVKVALCLSEERDERDIERILYHDSNIVEDLREFSEDRCPDLDVRLRNRSIVSGALGLFYLAYGFWSGDYQTALLFSIVGFIPYFYYQHSGYNEIRGFTLELDEINGKLEDVSKRIKLLRETCEKRSKD
ncbi:MAG: hypothetical protein GSR77_03790 [Desulfurococcales archaeon]|nr:hypothetical protein [Desulfurococcales archaeon]